MEKLNLFLEALLKFWPILVVSGGWLLAQKKAYEKRSADRLKREQLAEEKQKKLDEQNAQMLRAINGVGENLKKLEKKVGEDHVEELLRHSSAIAEIKEIKGKLEGILIFLPNNKTGHA